MRMHLYFKKLIEVRQSPWALNASHVAGVSWQGHCARQLLGPCILSWAHWLSWLMCLPELSCALHYLHKGGTLWTVSANLYCKSVFTMV